jgi:tetratricopeptide (TPR) repeat protein
VAQPKTQQSALFDELNALAENPFPSEFEIAAFRRKVERFKQTDLYHYRILMGALFAQLGDVEAAKKNHELAEQQQYCAQAVSNYGMSLQRLGFFVEAAEKFREAVKLEPEVVSHWKSLTTAQMLCGAFADAASTLKALLEKAPEAYRGDNFQDLVFDAARIVGDRQLQATELLAIPKLAVQCAQQAGAFRFRTGLGYRDDGDSRWMVLSILVGNKTYAEVANITDAFTDALAESDLSSASMVSYVVQFCPHYGHEPH